MEEVGRGSAGSFENLEVIRVEAGMPTTRFVQLIGIPERTRRRWQAKDQARTGVRTKGSWPQPTRQAAKELVRKHALAHPTWGHQKVWVMIRHDGGSVRIPVHLLQPIFGGGLPWPSPRCRSTPRGVLPATARPPRDHLSSRLTMRVL